jgi:hypothetical protein
LDTAVLIGWANNTDAQKAERAYASRPELQVKRNRNVIGYVRASDRTGATGILLPLRESGGV